MGGGRPTGSVSSASGARRMVQQRECTAAALSQPGRSARKLRKGVSFRSGKSSALDVPVPFTVSRAAQDVLELLLSPPDFFTIAGLQALNGILAFFREQGPVLIAKRVRGNTRVCAAISVAATPRIRSQSGTLLRISKPKIKGRFLVSVLQR